MPRNPVWKLGEESRWQGLGFIVFPGNVGDANSLVEIVEKLRKSQPKSR